MPLVGVNTPMSNDQRANEMFARKCLHNLCRDLLTERAKALCNELDRALRCGDMAGFRSLVSDDAFLRQDLPFEEVREMLQVVALIKFPFGELDPKLEFLRIRKQVTDLRCNPSHSDKAILRSAGAFVSQFMYDVMWEFPKRPRELPRSHRFLKHGPGVVSETSDMISKRQVLFTPRKLRDYEMYLPPCAQRRIWRESVSRTLLVPKDFKSLRPIAAEPTWNQWIQQGVMAIMYKKIASHPTIKRYLKLEDQEYQKSILRRTGVCTIDLSSASDTIRTKHLLLLGLPLDVREFLMTFRTERTEFRGSLYPTLGLFPMGAAVCFPFESIFFLGLCLAYSAAETGREPRNLGVFGDDIVIDDALGGGLCAFFRRIGLLPNMGKTFIGCNFKESCGQYIYGCRDITPVKLKKSFPTSEADERNIAYKQYSQECERRGFFYLAKFLQSVIKFKSTKRWNGCYQRLEVSTLKVRRRSLSGLPDFYPESLLRGACDVALSAITVTRGWEPIYVSK